MPRFIKMRAGDCAVGLAVILLFNGCAAIERGSAPKGEFSTKGKFEPVQTGRVVTTAVSLTNQIDAAWLKPSSDIFTLGPGDRLELEIIGETNSITSTVVGPDGKIYFNLLPGVDVWGLTLAETKAVLERELAKYIKTDPKISVMLRGVESRRVWLLGRLQVPGVYSIPAPMTLLEAISTAGGTANLVGNRDVQSGNITDELADLERSFVIRNGRMLPINFDKLVNKGDLSQNIYLQPDDFVYLPPATAREVYVLGAVGQARPVPYSENMTLATAIAGAFGTVKDAYLSHVAIVRGTLTQPEIAIVDYKDVVRGKIPDVALQPHDIVYVPYSPYRYITRYAELIVNTFVSSAAINAGTSVVPRDNGSGISGVVIPVGSRIQITPAPPAPPR